MRSSVPVGPGWWAGLGEAAGHSFARGGHDGVRGALKSAGSIRMARPRRALSRWVRGAAGGGHDVHDHAPTELGCSLGGGLLLEGANVVVAQGVVDVFELAAGGGHGADVGAAAGGDGVAEGAHDGVLGQPLN